MLMNSLAVTSFMTTYPRMTSSTPLSSPSTNTISHYLVQATALDLLL
jgi:hypothetical protein